MVVANEEIKRVTLEYCVKNLENGSPDPEVEQDATIKRQLHDMRMKDTDDDDFREQVCDKAGNRSEEAVPHPEWRSYPWFCDQGEEVC